MHGGHRFSAENDLSWSSNGLLPYDEHPAQLDCTRWKSILNSWSVQQTNIHDISCDDDDNDDDDDDDDDDDEDNNDYNDDGDVIVDVIDDDDVVVVVVVVVVVIFNSLAATVHTHTINSNLLSPQQRWNTLNTAINCHIAMLTWSQL